jgi:hypothetical protein
MKKDTPAKVDIGNKLQAARHNLFDLIMRNRLFNLKTNKCKAIKVFESIPGEIYDVLVLQENKMEFMPLNKHKGQQWV